MSSSYSHINDAHKLALDYLQKEDYQSAMLQFCISLETHPHAPDIYHDRALCFLKMERPQLALDDLNMALKLQPEHGYRYSSRAYVRAYLKDLNGAIEDYRIAIELDPTDAISMNNLGLLEEQFGRVATARELFEQADELNRILSDNKIDRASDLSTEPHHLKADTDTSVQKKTRWDIIAEVIKNPQERRAFLNFLKNGFRR